MNILMTGGSGFLGRQIVSAAEEAGYNICAPRSSSFNLETGKGVDTYMQEVSKENRGFDVLIHSAAYYGGIGIIQAEPAAVFNKNCQMGINVFEIAKKYKIPKVVAVGSACSYPGYLEGDLKEDRFWDGCLHETVEAYGFSKKLLLVGQKAYYKQYGITSNHLVLTNLYGPNDVFTEYRSHVVSALIKKFADATDQVVLWGDGSPIREFLYVRDAADAIVKAVTLAHDPDPINIGTGIGTRIKELAELTMKYTKFDGKITWDTSKPNGAPRKVLDINRMREKLDWYPAWTLEEGLKETIEWYLAHKDEADARQ